MTNPHKSIPSAAQRILNYLTEHYREHKKPMTALDLCASCFLSSSRGRAMVSLLHEAGLIVAVGVAGQTDRTDVKSQTVMYGPVGATMLPRVIRPLDIHAKPLPENHSLGARSAVQINPLPERPRKPKYKGEINPPQYRPAFEELSPQHYDLWQGRNLAMLTR